VKTILEQHVAYNTGWSGEMTVTLAVGGKPVDVTIYEP
jgi:hypothetical protein